MKYLFLKILYRLLKKNPATMDMVQYWKTRDTAQARVKRHPDGYQYMELENEKYPVMTLPRGYMLFGKLSKLKHVIKNGVFNDSWWALEKCVPEDEVISHAKEALFGEPMSIMEDLKYDMLPPEEFCPAVKEIHRAFTEVSKDLPEFDREKVDFVRDVICFTLQEDDGYRFRVQDLAEYFAPQRWYMKLWARLTGKTYLQLVAILLGKAFDTMVHCEVIDDMKDRIKLLKRIILLGLNDKKIGTLFERLCRELNWKKIYLTKGDRFNFRGKYYKVDYRVLEY